MPTYIAIGNVWLNVDKIQMVTVDDTDAVEPTCAVHLMGGETKEFSGEDAATLIIYLKQNRVPVRRRKK